MTIVHREHAAFFFDAAAAPAARAKSGETVRFCCRDCYDGQLDRDGADFSAIDMRRVNPVTGPLYVEGAEAGDVLRVEITDIALAAEGAMCVRRGVGCYDIEGIHCRRFPLEDGCICFDQGIRIPARPMIGVIGAAPAGAPVSSESPGEHGGNLDIPLLGVGAVVYLPVSAEGALLSLGDLHARQGDGETAVCALECEGEATLKVDVLKGLSGLPTPLIKTPEYYLCAAADESLDISSVAAAKKCTAS